MDEEKKLFFLIFAVGIFIIYGGMIIISGLIDFFTKKKKGKNLK